jgi:hypothetical protein
MTLVVKQNSIVQGTTAPGLTLPKQMPSLEQAMAASYSPKSSESPAQEAAQGPAEAAGKTFTIQPSFLGKLLNSDKTVVEQAVKIDRVTYDDNSVHLWSGKHKYSFTDLNPKQKAELIEIFAGPKNENVSKEQARSGDQWRWNSPSTWSDNSPYRRKSSGENPEDAISRPKDASTIELKEPMAADITRKVGNLNDGTSTWVERSGAVRYEGVKVTVRQEE